MLETGEANLGVERSDVYQMLAYARAYRAQRLVLLHPWHEALPEQGIIQRWQVAGTSTAFDVACVDVGRPDSVRAVLRQVAGVAEATTPVYQVAG